MRLVDLRSRAGNCARLLLFIWFVSIGGRVSQAAETLEVGYIPILPMAQLYVLEGEGWAKAAGLNLKKTPFPDGPGIVEALTSGKLDVAYFGIAPAMVAFSKGVGIKVVASNVVEQVALIARGDFTLYMLRDPLTGIQRFATRKGRKPRIASFSPGSVPYAVFRHWLLEIAKLPADSVDLVSMSATEIEQALLTGAVDGASTLEPVLTTVAAADRGAKVVLDGAEMMPNQPGAVLAVRSELIRAKPRIVRELVALHNRATDFIILHPDKAAQHAFGALQSASARLSLSAVEEAMVSPYSKFVADPYRILESTQTMHDFQLKMGLIAKPVKLDQLFDTRFYAGITDEQ